MSANCLFCKIASGEIKAALVAESDRCIAFRDIDPKAPVHCLVIPREHVDSLNGAHDHAMLGELMALAIKVASQEGIAESGYRVMANTNADGGQTVFHLHLHVLGGTRLQPQPR